MASLEKQAHARQGWVRIVCTAAVLTAVVGAAALAQDIIKTRQAGMKAQGQAMKTIDGIIKAGGSAADVVAPATKIHEVAMLIPSLFPAGSDQGDTGANKEIWDKFDDFKAKASDLEAQSKMLIDAANSG